MAAETLYREGRLSVSAIGEKLHISKSTLYSYLRHRGVEIGAYQKSARSRDQQPSAASPAEPPAAERVATVTLRLAVVNNSKFVRGRKRATENIERYCLEPYGMKRLDAGHYELTIPYRSDDELDKSVHDLLTEISQEADMRNCLSRWAPGKKTPKSVGRAYVGFWFHCSPNPTLGLALLSCLLATLIGAPLAIARLSRRRLLSWPARAYLALFRNTPLLVQLFFWYFGVPALLPEALVSWLNTPHETPLLDWPSFEFLAGAWG
ncbi:amino ABC transporter, permease, 3-TM region, His/Glu/Gln/Arg/opine family domain protein [Pseudomonas aeruginosa]|nr:amino ABC transporter, permease, 3-TM region, His/Glu/Gln/Arg/opine family domain protein [Pseudomonas aeruginosa]